MADTEKGKEYDPISQRPRNISEGLRRADAKAGVTLVDVTGVQGKEPLTGAIVAENLKKSMRQRRDERNGNQGEV